MFGNIANFLSYSLSTNQVDIAFDVIILIKLFEVAIFIKLRQGLVELDELRLSKPKGHWFQPKKTLVESYLHK